MAALTLEWDGYSLVLDGYTQLKPGAYYLLANQNGELEYEVPLLYCGKHTSLKVWIFKEKSDNDENINFGKVYTSMQGEKFIKYPLEGSIINDGSKDLKGLNNFMFYRITNIDDQQKNIQNMKKQESQ
jgi:hypothetical protein